MYSLQELGWCEFFQRQWKSKKSEGLVRARISEENRGLYKTISEIGERWAELRGKLRHEAASREMLPAVGDWVLAEEHGGRSTIHFVFDRRSKFSRKTAGKKTEEQIVAANVDTVLLVSSLNREFNARRIERYLTLAWESGARPIIVLNKADLCENVSKLRAQANEAAMGARTVAASIVSGDGIVELRGIVRTGGTTALLGSSGVGKSSLINAILGREIQATKEVRDGDDKGRHTTTSRQLIVVPGGGVLLDTPGMRELQLWDASEGIAQAFADVAALALGCKFRDCLHKDEPGCAVREAMDEERLANYHKLQREEQFLESKQDDALRAQRTKELRKMMKGVNRMYRERGR
ncbi:MAG TPA: ribosome small subunit-dependent GTPase A [Candidatus Angelobacter sp.]|nr:ribosome small subunit-dependent GTPase A [Candidatus Angelobacter sp.]